MRRKVIPLLFRILFFGLGLLGAWDQYSDKVNYNVVGQLFAVVFFLGFVLLLFDVPIYVVAEDSIEKSIYRRLVKKFSRKRKLVVQPIEDKEQLGGVQEAKKDISE